MLLRICLPKDKHKCKLGTNSNLKKKTYNFFGKVNENKYLRPDQFWKCIFFNVFKLQLNRLIYKKALKHQKKSSLPLKMIKTNSNCVNFCLKWFFGPCKAFLFSENLPNYQKIQNLIQKDIKENSRGGHEEFIQLWFSFMFFCVCFKWKCCFLLKKQNPVNISHSNLGKNQDLEFVIWSLQHNLLVFVVFFIILHI